MRPAKIAMAQIALAGVSKRGCTVPSCGKITPSRAMAKNTRGPTSMLAAMVPTVEQTIASVMRVAPTGPIMADMASAATRSEAAMLG